MAKIALLIGTSEYEPGLNPLLASVNDVEAMQQVLQNPAMGGFDEVKTIKNPDPQTMQYEVELLFSDRNRDDLLLLYFSGHGIKDDSGRLYFATRVTRKSSRNELIRSTAVPATFVHDVMNNSRAKRQAIILDCCFSGAFATGMTAKDSGVIDVKRLLGGEGRVVLTSSTSTQYSFEEQKADLSVYTRYLVEGIATGAADLDRDDVVSVDELHEYAKSRVQELVPAMHPEIYAVKQGYKIFLAKAPTVDPQLRYRKEVELVAVRGQISFVGRRTLDVLKLRLKLSAAGATEIENAVLNSIQEELQGKQQQYEQVLVELAERELAVTEDIRGELQNLQRVLGLRDDDVMAIDAQISARLETYKQNLQQYEQAISQAAWQEYPLTAQTTNRLQQLQQTLGLKEADATAIDSRITTEVAVYKRKLQEYEQSFASAVWQEYPLGEQTRNQLHQLQQTLSLRSNDVARLETRLAAEVEAYQAKLGQYEREFVAATQQQYPLEERTRNQLHQLQQRLGLKPEDTTAIAERIITAIESYRAKLQQYRQAFTEAVQQRYPLAEPTREQLNRVQQALELRSADANTIEASITAPLEDFRQKLREYEQGFAEALQHEYPLSEDTLRDLKNFQRVLSLQDEDIAALQERLQQQRQAELQQQAELDHLPQLLITPTNASIPVIPGATGRRWPTVRLPVTRWRSSKLLIAGGALAGALVLVAGYTLIQWQADQTLQATLKQARALETAGKHDDCVKQAQTIPANSRLYAEAQALTKDCQAAQTKAQLDQGKKLAADSKFKEAIALAAPIPKESPAYAEAQKLIDQWSESLLKEATQQYEAGKLDEAKATAKVIPADRPAGKKAQQQIAQWQKDWSTSETNLKTAQKALDQGNWQAAIDTAKKVSNTVYWQPETKAIIQKAQDQLAASRPIQPNPEPYTPPEPAYVAPAPTYVAPAPKPTFDPEPIPTN